MPPALALAESQGATGLEMLMAYMLGFEVACSIGEAMSPEYYDELGWHPTGPVGALGAAVASRAAGAGGRPAKSALFPLSRLSFRVRYNNQAPAVSKRSPCPKARTREAAPRGAAPRNRRSRCVTLPASQWPPARNRTPPPSSPAIFNQPSAMRQRDMGWGRQARWQLVKSAGKSDYMDRLGPDRRENN